MGSNTWNIRRRRLRRPLVCKSPKELPAATWPNSAEIIIGWSATQVFPPATTSKSATLTAIHAGGGIFIAATTDNQGRAAVITFTAFLGVNSTLAVAIVGIGPATDFSCLTGAIYSGVRPWSDPARVLTNHIAGPGGGSYTASLASS